jgi:hypothetical protein
MRSHISAKLTGDRLQRFIEAQVFMWHDALQSYSF